MSLNISFKPTLAPISVAQAHPFETRVRLDIAELRGQLTVLRGADQSDGLVRNRVKNLEAQLGKKNAYLASLSASVEKPVVQPEAPKVAPPPRPATKASAQSAKPQAPAQAFGALGARLKGSLAPNIAARLTLTSVPEVEGF